MHTHPVRSAPRALALFTSAAFLASPCGAQQVLRSERVVNGLQVPVWVGGPPGDPSRLFAVERGVTTPNGVTGRVRVINGLNTATPTLNATPFFEVPGVASNSIEQGLLSLAFHPDYDENGYFWFVYSRTPDWYWVLARGRRSANNPDQADPAFEVVWTFAHPRDNHYSGWIEFGPDGYLYVGSGDGGGGNDDQPPSGATTGNAQDTTDNKLGKIFRIDVDGWDNIPGNADDDGLPADTTRNYRNPLDNPFFGVTGDDEIWAWGVRNPWRNSIDTLTGEVYVADVGQDIQEEISVIPGAPGFYNLGWRCYEGTRETGLGGCSPLPTPVVMPILTYGHYTFPIPPLMNEGCALTGGVVYRGASMPCFQGHYIFADWCSGDIFSFKKDASGAVTQLLARRTELDPPGTPSIDRITSFGTDMFGEIYAVDQMGGEVFRFLPGGYSGANADCNNNSVPDSCDIATGASADADLNGIPDECPVCDSVDFNNDTLFPDIADISDFIAVFGGEPCPTPACNDSDFNNDSLFPDILDIQAIISVFGGGPCLG